MSPFKSQVIRGCYSDKMAELTPDLYQELIKYKTEGKSYFRQPIDLSSYLEEDKLRKAA